MGMYWWPRCWLVLIWFLRRATAYNRVQAAPTYLELLSECSRCLLGSKGAKVQWHFHVVEHYFRPKGVHPGPHANGMSTQKHVHVTAYV